MENRGIRVYLCFNSSLLQHFIASLLQSYRASFQMSLLRHYLYHIDLVFRHTKREKAELTRFSMYTKSTSWEYHSMKIFTKLFVISAQATNDEIKYSYFQELSNLFPTFNIFPNNLEKFTFQKIQFKTCEIL